MVMGMSVLLSQGPSAHRVRVNVAHRLSRWAGVTLVAPRGKPPLPAAGPAPPPKGWSVGGSGGGGHSLFCLPPTRHAPLFPGSGVSQTVPSRQWDRRGVARLAGRCIQGLSLRKVARGKLSPGPARGLAAAWAG